MGNSKSKDKDQSKRIDIRSQHDNVSTTRSSSKPAAIVHSSLNNAARSNKRQTRKHAKLRTDDWLKANDCFHSNIAWMLNLQDIENPHHDLRKYTASDYQELFQYCMNNKSAKNQPELQRSLEVFRLLCMQIADIDIPPTAYKLSSSPPIYQQEEGQTKKKQRKQNKKKPKQKKKKTDRDGNSSQTASIKSSQARPNNKGNDGASTDDSKLFSYKEMLVYGYLRNLEQTLFTDIIIPFDVCHLVLIYFSHNEIFLLHLPKTRASPCMVKVRNDYYSTHSMRIFELDTGEDSTQFTDDAWQIESASLLFQKNVRLPPLMTQKLNYAYNRYYRCFESDYYGHSSSDTYAIIFARGSDDDPYGSSVSYLSKKCYAMSFNERELHKSDTASIVGFKYALPSCKRELSELVFSERYGLIAVGGGISIYNLSFRNDAFLRQDKKQWKWLSFGHLQARRKQFATVMLDTKRLMVVGGDPRAGDATSELIDLSGHRNARSMLTKCSMKRYKCGVMYDNYNKRVFAAGGEDLDGEHYQYPDAVDEMYDAEKDTWIPFAKWRFREKHAFSHWPSMYSLDKQVIYMTNGNNAFQCIDLRENKQEWSHYKPSINFGSKTEMKMKARQFRIVTG